MFLAGLGNDKACVRVVPPLLTSGPRFGIDARRLPAPETVMKQVGQEPFDQRIARLDGGNDGNVRVLVEMSTRVPKVFVTIDETRVSEGRTAFS